HPDVAALRVETIEENPAAIGRPDWIIDAHFAVLELEDLFGLARGNRRDPEGLVSDDIHDPGVVRRKGDERPAGTLGQEHWLSSVYRNLQSLRLASARTAEHDTVAVARPTQEVAGDTDPRELPRSRSIGVHDPDLEASALVRLIGDLAAVGREERIDVVGRRLRELEELAGLDLDFPDVRVAGAG